MQSFSEPCPTDFTPPRRSRGSHALWAVAFVGLRLLGAPWIDSAVDYEPFRSFAPYVWDTLFVTAALIAYRGHVRWQPDWSGGFFTCLALTALGGIGVARLVPALGLAIPFALDEPVTLWFLLGVAPLLEEALYRQALWWPVELGTGRRRIAWILTSLAFAAAHGIAYTSVPPEARPFVVYQTCYTLALSLAWGPYLSRVQSLTNCWALHFAFNLGFWAAAR